MDFFFFGVRHFQKHGVGFFCVCVGGGGFFISLSPNSNILKVFSFSYVTLIMISYL